MCTTVIQTRDFEEETVFTPVDKDDYYQFRATQPNTVSHSDKFFDYVYGDLISSQFQFLKVQSGTFEGYCVCTFKDDCAIIKEVLPIDCGDSIANCFCKEFNVKNVLLISRIGNKKHPFALFRNFGCGLGDNIYANLLLDSFGG